MTTLVSWRPWFAWRPVRLQSNGLCVWLRRVEYEQIRIPIYTAFGGRSIDGVVTHYRLLTTSRERVIQRK